MKRKNNSVVGKPERNKIAVPDLFSSLGIDKISRKDSFTVNYADDLLTVSVRRQNGNVETIRKVMGAGFSETTTITAERMSRADRDTVILKLSREGMTQTQIARKLGVSQPTVSYVLRRDG